jgi:glyoxylase I family protein
MLELNKVHHIAIICSDYQKSKQFYTEILGLTILQEIYREERDSYKLDLALNGEYIVELFSFPNPSERLSRPEACGLRHLVQNNISSETIRIDEFSAKRFFFIADPDGLPLEFYEI